MKDALFTSRVRLPASGTAWKNCLVRWLLVSHSYLCYNKDSLLCLRLLMSSPSNTQRPSRTQAGVIEQEGVSPPNTPSFSEAPEWQDISAACTESLKTFPAAKQTVSLLREVRLGDGNACDQREGGDWLLLTAILLVSLDFKEESKTKLVF